MKWPTIKEVASELRDINAELEVYMPVAVGDLAEAHYIDVRLQVYPENERWQVPAGGWALRVGDPSYDQDHQGYWGASTVPGCFNGKVRRFNSYDTAKDLLEQAKDQYYQEVE